jgi:peroxiredoxin (alkyl hydroperoxide reductase subunit C)
MGVLVGKQAPDFKATAVIGGDFKEVSLADYKGKNVLLFFYPLDFTFVCPTEMHAFQEKYEDFKKLNTEVIGVSIDSQFSHLAWLNTPKTEGGIEGVRYPIVADINKTISRDYDVLVPGAGIAFRGAFLIDKAWQFHEEHGEVCPANWKKGEKSMKPDQSGLKSYFGG